MSEQAPQYHKAVEQNYFTSGPDIGRTQPTELVYEHAIEMNKLHDKMTRRTPGTPASEEYFNEKDNKELEAKVGESAVRDVIYNHMPVQQQIARSVQSEIDHPRVHNTLAKKVAKASKEASKAIKDSRTLEEVAAKENYKLGRAKKQYSTVRY